MDRREEKYYSKRISEASQKIKDGYIPRIKVNPTSQTFNIELIKYYCNYLESKGYDSIVRCYVPMPLKPIVNKPKWHAWEKDSVSQNLRIFFSNFYRIHKSCLLRNFLYVERKLDLFEGYNLVIYVLRFIGDGLQKPMLECYEGYSASSNEKITLYFQKDDPNCPVNLERMYKDENWSCLWNGNTYEPVTIRTHSLDFLFDASPTYTLMNELLEKKTILFFDEKKALKG